MIVYIYTFHCTLSPFSCFYKIFIIFNLNFVEWIFHYLLNNSLIALSWLQLFAIVNNMKNIFKQVAYVFISRIKVFNIANFSLYTHKNNSSHTVTRVIQADTSHYTHCLQISHSPNTFTHSSNIILDNTILKQNSRKAQLS